MISRKRSETQPTRVVDAFDGKLVEVHGFPSLSFKPFDNEKFDLKTKRIRT
jgi:hypothetical protein